ncbi:Cocaine esterase [Austwickia sp. TVS 96-490-7B]|uniref:CocE/NonD family hydrolase n=1 Tax=Austwickia sp. TVS 96-490-7B TaxID=2830843 RepID=UPI001C5888F0|nr:CocE/NonD family hydrolase [Austwickia sp. TVS 96-490-7B]MBW3085513.1 Cocaine esterase [Austwickia sp. TVS 96-490-7B]
MTTSTHTPLPAATTSATTVPITTVDGHRLHTLHLPATTTDTRGTVLLRTPYGVEALLPEARSWAGAGYRTYLQDVRGRYRSEGHWTPYAHEGSDGADTVRALHRDGGITGPLLLSGSSYGAHAAIDTARALTVTDSLSARPAGVIAMVPALGLWDTAHAPDGTPRLRDRIGWWWQHGHGSISHTPLDPTTLDALTHRATHSQVTELFADHPDLDGPWRRLWSAPRPDPTTRWSGLHTPLLVIGGSRDFFAEDSRCLVQHWPGPAALLWGDWGHGLGTHLPATHPVRQALRAHGGLLPPILTWADAAAHHQQHPDVPHPHLTARCRLDPIHGWRPLPDREEP